MVMHYIATRSLMELCKAAERKQGAQLGMRWCGQEGIYLTGSREKASMAAVTDKDRMEE